jgi:hypothetical protein
MALFLRMFSIFCGLGGPNVGSFIAPFFPGFLSSSFIPIFLIVMLGSNANIINSSQEGETRKKNWGKGAGLSFLIYYLVLLFLACSILQTACRVNENINPF